MALVVVQQSYDVVLLACYVVVCWLVACGDPCRSPTNREGTLAQWGPLAMSGRNVGHRPECKPTQSNPRDFFSDSSARSMRQVSTR
ncbi:hypothetical protein L209DRAFT_24979 [Thermothelomyces heterothallicus CBS 203.75]